MLQSARVTEILTKNTGGGYFMFTLYSYNIIHIGKFAIYTRACRKPQEESIVMVWFCSLELTNNWREIHFISYVITSVCPHASFGLNHARHPSSNGR